MKFPKFIARQFFKLLDLAFGGFGFTFDRASAQFFFEFCAIFIPDLFCGWALGGSCQHHTSSQRSR